MSNVDYIPVTSRMVFHCITGGMYPAFVFPDGDKRDAVMDEVEAMIYRADKSKVADLMNRAKRSRELSKTFEELQTARRERRFIIFDTVDSDSDEPDHVNRHFEGAIDSSKVFGGLSQ